MWLIVTLVVSSYWLFAGLVGTAIYYYCNKGKIPTCIVMGFLFGWIIFPLVFGRRLGEE